MIRCQKGGRVKRSITWAANILLLAVLAFALVAILLPSVLSGTVAIVRSSSMEPTLPAGSLAIMMPIQPASIRVGDIIAFHPPWDEDVVVSHRVAEVVDDGFVTQGDAVEDADPMVIPKENVVGRLRWHLPYLGYLINNTKRFTSTVWGFLALVVLPALLVFASAAREAYVALRPGAARRKRLEIRERRLARRAPRAWKLRRAT